MIYHSIPDVSNMVEEINVGKLLEGFDGSFRMNDSHVTENGDNEGIKFVRLVGHALESKVVLLAPSVLGITAYIVVFNPLLQS